MSKFEVELRGLLNKKQKDSLESFLKKNGKYLSSYKRKQWIFGLSHLKKIDLRIKNTNGEYEFSLKTGAAQHFNRREISIPFPKEKADQALEFLKLLGKDTGVIAIRNASIYKYKGIEWAIVEVPKHSWYFEAEKMANDHKSGEKVKKEILEVTKKLELSVLNSKQTIEYIKRLDKEANKEFKL